jgi:hypothetical protein
LTHVCLLCTDKVCRWKFFHCLWFSLTIHLSLSVSEVSYKPLISHTISFFSFFFNFFINTFCMWNLSWLNMSALTLYDKLSSSNNNNNNNVSVIQICVSELTAQSSHSLWCICCCSHLVTADDDSVLFVDQQQLTLYAHFLRQWSFSHCLMWMFCLYSSVSHWIRWELISCHTSMWFWFRVRGVDFCQLY